MNHCRDCNSDYLTPETCNCFAVGGKRYGALWWTVPYYPMPWYPTYPPTYPYWHGTNGTISVGAFPESGAAKITVTYGAENTTSSSVSLEHAMQFSAGFSLCASGSH